MEGRIVQAQAADGLKLGARIFEADTPGERLPAVCLAGLTRNGRDFAALARALAANALSPRTVVAIDSRGRGLSDRDPDPSNYTVVREADDALAFLDRLGIGRAILVGTSRGGLLAPLVAAKRPGLVRGVVLNDIGPVIETGGLVRIRSYVGAAPARASLDEAAAALQALHGAYFPGLDAVGWLAFAAATHRNVEDDGKGVVLDYDPALARALDGLDAGKGAPPAWELFDALNDVPVLLVRGALSDLLSAETAAAMAARHPDLAVHTVANEGHAPLLADAETIAVVARFCRRCDAGTGTSDGAGRARPA